MQRSSPKWVRQALIPAAALLSAALAAPTLAQTPAPQAAPPKPPPASSTCTDVPHSDHPHATLTNGSLNAFVFLPSIKDGSYRAARFDWSGIVACASLNGHTFFGEWFSKYNPMTNDAVTGPAEEFRAPIGYDDAKPGEGFLKVGDGILSRIDTKPYTIGGAYPYISHGRWTSKVGPNSITFRQTLHSPLGYGYVYEKTLSLEPGQNILRIRHVLRNTGTKAIDTSVYAHDFFMLDNKATGPGMQVHFGFTPVFERPIPDSAVLEGRTLRYLAAPQPHHSPGGPVTGFSHAVSDFSFTFEDTDLGIGVEETADSPMESVFFWCTPDTVAPEGFIGIHVKSGETQTWQLTYRFFTK